MSAQTALADPEAQNAGSVLVFRLDGDAFAITVTAVHEILDAQEPTPVPNADAFAPGVINVRGVVVPVVDIRCRLEMEEAPDHADCRMIVVEVPFDDVQQKLAFVADAVEDVIELDSGSVERIPELAAIWPQVYLQGAARRNGELIIVLDAATLFRPRPSA